MFNPFIYWTPENRSERLRTLKENDRLCTAALKLRKKAKKLYDKGVNLVTEGNEFLEEAEKLNAQACGFLSSVMIKQPPYDWTPPCEKHHLKLPCIGCKVEKAEADGKTVGCPINR